MMAGLSTIVAQGNIGSNVGSAGKTCITANGTTSYVLTVKGLQTLAIQTLRLKGGTYTFNMTAAGHPFYLNSVQGTGTANAYALELQIMELYQDHNFTVPMNAPNTLYYNCQFHGSMFGTITN
jgi:hypothetical protein